MIIKNNGILYVIILLVTIILYYPSLNSYFVNDDYNWIKQVSFSEIISTFWGSWGHATLYRPLTRLVLYIEFLIFNTNPFGFHIISLFLHSAVLFLTFRISVLIFNSERAGYLMLTLALFFFPFHEVVCWISCQTILLGSALVSLSLYYFIIYLNNKQSKYYYYYSAAYLFSLLSYESSVALPALCLISYFIFYEFNFQNIKKVLRLLFPLFMLSIIYLIYRKIIFYGLPGTYDTAENISGWFNNYADFFNHQINKNTPLLVLFIISLISLFWIKKSQWKYVLFSLLWIFCAFLPFSVLGGYTGRFGYYSLIGIFYFISYLLINLISRFNKLRIPLITLIIVYCFINIYKINQNANYWYEAGEIAKGIPLQLKSLHSHFPENSTLIFYDIPVGYSQSGVFFTYFEDVIQSNYKGKLNVIHASHPLNKDFKKDLYDNKENVFRFRYYLNDRKLKEIN